MVAVVGNGGNFGRNDGSRQSVLLSCKKEKGLHAPSLRIPGAIPPFARSSTFMEKAHTGAPLKPRDEDDDFS
jgi:hypothetical protein